MCGGTGTGKTTFLNAISGYISNNERIITVEDTAELRLQQPHWVSLESRPPNVEGKGATYTTDADFKAIENAVARIQIPKGNQISKYAITSLSPEAGLSSKIPVQMRGYMINIPISTASMIKPDDNVDVLLTFEAVMKSGDRRKVAVTLLQNVKVLGVGTDLGQGLDAKSASAMKPVGSVPECAQRGAQMPVGPNEPARQACSARSLFWVGGL